jgi:hypothetical protein
MKPEKCTSNIRLLYDPHFMKPEKCTSDIRPLYDVSPGSRELCYMKNMVAGMKWQHSRTYK